LGGLEIKEVKNMGKVKNFLNKYITEKFGSFIEDIGRESYGKLFPERSHYKKLKGGSCDEDSWISGRKPK